MNENLRCPMCDSSDLKEENGYYVCQICGNKTPVPPVADKKTSEEKTQIASKKQKKSPPDRLITNGCMGFGIGFILLLGIIFVGLSVYGKVYLYNGYEYTAVLTTISIIAMVMGFIVLVIGLIAKFYFNKK